ncbi:hypothetical protein PV04_07764 [Phialophora macrospora]|uniref:Zn(2)-C6 fungal-type domain-containing protein n=1 Tax=Phialophora macrospora TaxID=1851006 RepID=A0A0D2G0B1_9EURO|nr:hypothetical protein PV04_07764 [Phialophora macrospora]
MMEPDLPCKAFLIESSKRLGSLWIPTPGSNKAPLCPPKLHRRSAVESLKQRKMPRQKTFTGCWTCRVRRMKCDETKPECGQCLAKGVVCEGYFTKLQWLPPIYNHEPTTFEVPRVRGAPRRRLLPAELDGWPALRMTRLSEADIGRAVSDVEKSAAALAEPKSIGPFSAFPLTTKVNGFADSPAAAEPPIISSRVELSVEVEQDPEGANVPVSGTDRTEDSLSTGFNHDLAVDDATVFDAIVFDPESHLPSATPVESHFWRPIVADEEGGWPLQTSTDPRRKRSTSARGSVREFDGSGFLTSQIKYLIRNYAQNVIPIYCVLEAASNPWQSFMLPRVLQCCTELEILGQSTTPRQALLYAVLSISAYNLQNVSPRYETWQGLEWDRVASSYKGKALRLIESCLGSSILEDISTDHDELLAAMLSMVTIDVMSGDMMTSHIHLRGCETLRCTQIRRHGDSLSHVTKSLHKVFIYLSVMQQASSLLFSGPDEVVASCDDAVMASPPWSDIDPCPDDLEAMFGAANDEDQISSSSFEMIYGVCQSLVYLLRKTTGLLLADFGSESTHTSPSGSRQREYEDIEAEVLEWPVEKKIAILRTAPTTPDNLLVMEHYSRAFHHALIIFWHCRIRKMHRRYVKPYVGKVLSHLEQIERAKHELGIRSGHIPWPAFVAASQAIDAEVRARFLAWFDKMAEEGMGSSRISKEALVTIWRQNQDVYSPSSLQMPNFVLA